MSAATSPIASGHATSTLSDPDSTVSSNAFSSLYGGVQGGYNYVLPSRLLLGAEADITFPNFEKYTDGLIFTGERRRAPPSPTRSTISRRCAAASATRSIIG